MMMAHAMKTLPHDISAHARWEAAPLAGLLSTLQNWHTRITERAQLAEFTSRELQDVGLTCADRSYLLDKPLWLD
jgi:uncharacterized protein YjiS (DUF1127 family)